MVKGGKEKGVLIAVNSQYSIISVRVVEPPMDLSEHRMVFQIDHQNARCLSG